LHAQQHEEEGCTDGDDDDDDNDDAFSAGHDIGYDMKNCYQGGRSA
jgi:hypothetical protein